MKEDSTDIILKAENISKQYRLGTVGTGTISHDLNRWWHKVRGKDDPFLKVGSVNDRSTKADSDYVWALQDINFEVQRGEVLGIIGKNGAGKSTLLKILSRVTSPTTGEIKTKGRIASLLEVGTGFHPEMTGRENVYLNGAILGMTKKEIQSKINEIISFSGCERYIDTPVKRYSSGMTVRLAFAVAAHLEPDILVIDEVLAVGDAEFQKKAIGKMQDISRGEGRTVLFVSHSMAAVKSLCTRAIVLEHGTTVFEGNVHAAVDFYLKKDRTKEHSEIGLRKDRSGSGEIRIDKIELYSKSNTIIDSAISGEYVRIRVEFKIDKQVEDNLIFGFSIYDSQEQMKAMVVTDEMGIDINTILEKGFLDIVIKRVLLRGGVYNFQFILSKRTTQKENHIDYIEKGFYLHVLPGDFYNIGHMNRRYNTITLPCKIS